MATLVVDDGVCSGRAACRYLGLGPSTWRYQARPSCERRQRLIVRSHELSALHPRYGYLRGTTRNDAYIPHYHFAAIQLQR